MTSFSYLELTTLDLDWFAIDAEERIGHFMTSMSPCVPPQVASSKENLKKLYDYFEHLPPDVESSRLSSNLLDRKPWLSSASQIQKENYIGAATDWSDRGLFSFHFLAEEKRGGYFLVGEPAASIVITDLPLEIRKLLKVRFDKPFGEELIVIDPMPFDL